MIINKEGNFKGETISSMPIGNNNITLNNNERNIKQFYDTGMKEIIHKCNYIYKKNLKKKFLLKWSFKRRLNFNFK